MVVHTTRFRIQRQFWHFLNLVLPFPLTVWPFVVAFVVFFFQLNVLLRLYTEVLPFPINVSLMVGVSVGVYKLLDKPQIGGLPLPIWLQLHATYWLFEPRVMVDELDRAQESKGWHERLYCRSPKRG